MSTGSFSGGTWKWGLATRTADKATGISGQPVVQANGTVIVPIDNAFESVLAFRSTDGGATSSATQVVAKITDHAVAGNLRAAANISAAIGADGRVYVAWQNCRFRKGCRQNDIVFITSTDGLTWSTVQRVPIDALTSTVDHFIPGIALTGSGATTIAITYYYSSTIGSREQGTDSGDRKSAAAAVAAQHGVCWLPPDPHSPQGSPAPNRIGEAGPAA